MSFIIDKTGKRIDCNGASHERLIHWWAKCSILKFMEHGGVRVKVHGESIAIEYRKPISDKQSSVISKALKEQDIFCIVFDSGLEYNRIEKFRPIRKLVFDGTLVPK